MAGTTMYAALLRGINVGGNRKLPMKALAALFEDAGCTNVKTYIQSGNVVFGASSALAKRIPASVGTAIETLHGFSVPMVTRSAGELAAIVEGNPYVAEGKDIAQLHVVFLPRRPSASAVLDPNRSPGDAFAMAGREIYLHLPNGMARTKFGNDYLDRRLDMVTTIRNWRTVVKLRDMTAG